MDLNFKELRICDYKVGKEINCKTYIHLGSHTFQKCISSKKKEREKYGRKKLNMYSKQK